MLAAARITKLPKDPLNVMTIKTFAPDYEYIVNRVIMPRIKSTIYTKNYYEQWSFKDFTHYNFVELNMVLSMTIEDQLTSKASYNINIHETVLEVHVERATEYVLAIMETKRSAFLEEYNKIYNKKILKGKKDNKKPELISNIRKLMEKGGKSKRQSVDR